MKKVIFWGATGQAIVLREALSEAGASLVAMFDTRPIASPFDDVDIHCGEAGFDAWNQSSQRKGTVFACVAIGGSLGKDRLARMEWLEARGYAPLTVIHPRSFVAADARLGKGCQVLTMAAVCSGARLGNAVIVNTKASVDHGCQVGDGVHVAPGATLAGEVVIEDFAFVGAGAVILPRIQIGTGAIVGAGAVVTRNVAAGETVVGNPARKYMQEQP